MRDVHRRVQELLPWYVTGTLSSADHSTVEQHVRECLPCRRALHDERSLHHTIRESAVPTRESHDLAKLLQAIDDRHGPIANEALSRRRLLGAPVLVTAMAGTITVVVAVGLWLTLGPGYSTPPREGAGDFATLSDAGPETGVLLDVVFTDDISPAAARDILGGLQARIVSGPSAIGRYSVEVEADGSSDTVLEALRGDSRVRIVSVATSLGTGQ